MFNFPPLLILVISKNKLTEQVKEQGCVFGAMSPLIWFINCRFNTAQAINIKTDYSIRFLRYLCVFWYIWSLILSKNKQDLPIFILSISLLFQCYDVSCPPRNWCWCQIPAQSSSQTIRMLNSSQFCVCLTYRKSWNWEGVNLQYYMNKYDHESW